MVSTAPMAAYFPEAAGRGGGGGGGGGSNSRHRELEIREYRSANGSVHGIFAEIAAVQISATLRSSICPTDEVALLLGCVHACFLSG